MPLIIAMLMQALLWVAGSVVAQVLVSLAIGVVTYTGIDLSLNWLKDQALSSLQGLGPDVVSLLSYLKVGVCINIITSAIVMRMAAQGMKNGATKAFRKK